MYVLLFDITPTVMGESCLNSIVNSDRLTICRVSQAVCCEINNEWKDYQLAHRDHMSSHNLSKLHLD